MDRTLVLLVIACALIGAGAGALAVSVADDPAPSYVADLDARGGTVHLDTWRTTAAPTYNYIRVPAEASVSYSGGVLLLSGVSYNGDGPYDLAVEVGSVAYVVFNAV